MFVYYSIHVFLSGVSLIWVLEMSIPFLIFPMNENIEIWVETETFSFIFVLFIILV